MKSPLLAIDPGANQGWALFMEGIPKGTRAKTEWHLYKCGLDVVPMEIHPGAVVIEKPVIYPHSKSRPNDIITLAIAAGVSIGQLMGRWEGLEDKVRWIEPRLWKGTINKAVMTQRIMNLLHPREQGMISQLAIPASKLNNVLDAIGLGFYVTGRLIQTPSRAQI